MAEKHRPFPHTHLDAIKAHRPFMLPLVKAEVKALQAQGAELAPDPINSELIKETFRQTALSILKPEAERLGIPVSQWFDGEHIRPGVFDHSQAAMYQAL